MINDVSKNNIENIEILDLSNTDISNVKINKQIKCLCFSGGGVKGFSFIGALEKLIEKNIIEMDKITLYAGTSVGSMISFLLCIGLNIDEIKEFLLAFNFSKLNGEIDCLNLFENFGINNGERIKLLLIKFLEKKLNVKDITFDEFYKKTNKKIIIIGTNLTKSCERVFSVDTSPQFSVITAIRISISVPVIFTPIQLDGDVYVDGGLVNNFPINHCPENETLGFYIKNSNGKKIDGIQSLILSCLGLLTDTLSEKSVEKYENNIIKIVNPNYEFTNFDLNLEYKKILINLGSEAAEKYCDEVKN